jgi:serine/threonine protein kinase
MPCLCERASSPNLEDHAGADTPKVFGRYQVIRHIASGGMGSVYLARDGVLQREVAVKSIRPMPGKLGQEFSARFLNEARCVASLKHPNIVPVFDLGLEGDTPYIVMEVVEVDFGVAHVPDSSLTTVGDFLGTPAYAAPESLHGKGFSPASDV